jgi:parvulin-like peptidyl-prolyl isomerase
MKKLLITALSAICFTACAQKEPAPSSVVLAKVGGYPITQEDLDEKAQTLDKDFTQYLTTPSGKENFLGFMINERLLSVAARDMGIEASPEYQNEIDAIKREQARSLRQAKEFALRRMLKEKLAQGGTLTVTEKEAQAYYKQHPYQIYLMHILLADPQEADTVLRAVKGIHSPAAFATAAQRYSIDPQTKNDGGRLPPFIPGEYMQQIEVPAANVPAGQVQGFIKTPQGFHIIMKVKEENLSYAQAKDRIYQILEGQKMDAYLNSLKDKYGVEVKNEVK